MLTEEQQTEFSRIKHRLQYTNHYGKNAAADIKKLIAMIESVPKQEPQKYTDDEIKEKCKYSLDLSTLENRDQYYLGYRSAFLTLGLLK